MSNQKKKNEKQGDTVAGVLVFYQTENCETEKQKNKQIIKIVRQRLFDFDYMLLSSILYTRGVQKRIPNAP